MLMFKNNCKFLLRSRSQTMRNSFIYTTYDIRFLL